MRPARPFPTEVYSSAVERLENTLRRIDGRGYRAYKDLAGRYHFPSFDLFVDHVQGDPFAAPSRIAVTVDAPTAGLPSSLWERRCRRIATEDWLTRRVWEAIPDVFRGGRGSGKSGKVSIDRPGQEVLERTSCLIDDGGVELRLTVGLPAAGRRVLGREAHAILCEELPALVQRCLVQAAHDEGAMGRHADCIEDQGDLRASLGDRGLVAFVGEGSLLPRQSGVDDRPLQRGGVPFGPIPDSMLVELPLTNGGTVRGLGVRRGVTLIVGGGYHGKSTLLESLARGIYDHLPGDGRERVVTSARTLCVRAEDGRAVSQVGIDGFIGALPNGVDTRRFSTTRASGSTSQATAIMEALEAGADTLLIDEDTSASNFLARDHRMQRLVPKACEPILPFVDRVRELHDAHGASTVMVLGGSSDYFEVCDSVIQMDAYRPRDATDTVRRIVAAHPSARESEAADEALVVRHRRPTGAGLEPTVQRRGGPRARVKAMDTRAIRLGEHELDISLLAQIVAPSQTRALADALVYVHRELADGQRTVAGIVASLGELIAEGGVCRYAARGYGDRAAVRALDVATAMNRLRELGIRTEK